MDWIPQPKQQLALVRLENEILYGGARGGGKTDAGMAWLLYDKDHPLYRALVIRRNSDDLKDWVDRARNFYKPLGVIIAGNPPEIRFPSGALFRTGHLKDENAYSKYQGHEYQKILIEELTHIPRESDYEKLLGSNRSSVAEIKPQVFATTNPDGPGYKWVKKRFRISDEPDEIIETVNDVKGGQRKLVFIPARVEDNPKLIEADPQYVTYLESIKDDDLRNAWRRGSWTGFNVEGSVYSEQIKRAREDKRIGNVPYDDNLLVHTVWDLGLGDSMSIGFFQTHLKEERMIDYYENSNQGFSHYMKVLREKPYVYDKHFAPHDIMVREMGSGKSRYETALKLGLKFEVKSEMKEVNGVMVTKIKSVIPMVGVQEGIDQAKSLWNYLWIDENKCARFIDVITNYRRQYNEKMGEYSKEPLHDWASHGADMLRYKALVPQIQKIEGNKFIHAEVEDSS